jgi:hypothetical protein
MLIIVLGHRAREPHSVVAHFLVGSTLPRSRKPNWDASLIPSDTASTTVNLRHSKSAAYVVHVKCTSLRPSTGRKMCKFPRE